MNVAVLFYPAKDAKCYGALFIFNENVYPALIGRRVLQLMLVIGLK